MEWPVEIYKSYLLVVIILLLTYKAIIVERQQNKPLFVRLGNMWYYNDKINAII